MDEEIERSIKARHPDLQMGPEVLKAAVRQALQDTEFTLGRRPQRQTTVARPSNPDESAAEADR
jgi:hypothetical protein